jgi:hypothetical protein
VVAFLQPGLETRSRRGRRRWSDADEIKADLSRVLFKLFAAIHAFKIARSVAGGASRS